MANVKISELPVATSLNGADSFPVVQGGVTKQAARSVLFASPTFTGTTTADILTATGDVSFDGGAFVFNDSGADKDARFEGDTDANLLFLDASTDRVGIGTSSPAYKLDVRGGIIANGNGTIVGGISYSTRPEIGALSNHPVGFITNNTTQMLLDTSGNLGIGTSSPEAKFHADGNVLLGNGAINTQTAPSYSGLWVGFDAGSNTAILQAINASTSSLSFHTKLSGAAPVERMRIDALGNLIYRVNGTAPTLSTDSTMSFELTSNTSLKIVVRGTDGVTRSVSLTLS